MRNIIITAHSGCEGTPDNSMESIFKGIELGADCVEIDIRKNDQGALCLTHNVIEDYSNCVPLEEALGVICKSGLAVNCDLKTEDLLHPVLETAEAIGFKREKLVFSGSVNVDLLRKDPSIAKRARIFLNLEQIYPHLPYEKPQNRDEEAVYFDAHVEDIAAVVKEVGAECVNPSFRMMSPERIALSLSHGINLSLWTINEEADQRAFIRENLVNVTTRNVSGALKIRKEIRG